MRGRWRFGLSRLGVLKPSLVKPRRAVLDMSPYSPPTGKRLGKMRLDFNENTVGCSPRVIEHLKQWLSGESLAVYPDYTETKAALAGFFMVKPEELLLTNGTDEAIQVLVNTYVDDGDEVVVTRPSYAMYRFYAEVAGAKMIEIDYLPPEGGVSFGSTTGSDYSEDPRGADCESE